MFVAYLVSYTGTAMAAIAMASGVLELTGSAADAAFVIAAPTAASIVVLLLGGIVADRTSRQRMMILAEITAAAAQCSMAALFISGTVVNRVCVGQRPCCGIPCARSNGTYRSASAQERAAGE